LRRFRSPHVVAGPVHDLEAFQAAVAAGAFHAYARSARDPVIGVFGCSRREAGRIIQRIVAGLTSADFARSVKMDNGATADEYGRMYADLGWYVKLLFNRDDGEAEVCSCHLTRFPLTTRTVRLEAFDPYDD
jgi:hypothetical protein